MGNAIASMNAASVLTNHSKCRTKIEERVQRLIIQNNEIGHVAVCFVIRQILIKDAVNAKNFTAFYEIILLIVRWLYRPKSLCF